MRGGVRPNWAAAGVAAKPTSEDAASAQTMRFNVSSFGLRLS